MVKGMPAVAAPEEIDASDASWLHAGGCAECGLARIRRRERSRRCLGCAASRAQGEPTLNAARTRGGHVNAVYLIVLGLGVPALTFSGLWFWRLRHQRHAGGRLTETEIAARIAARQEELRQEREARDEHLAGLIAHLLQSAVDARSLQNAADARSESHAARYSAERPIRQ
jgi:hypothetical protein